MNTKDTHITPLGKLNVHGMEITVASEEDCAKCDVSVHMRVKDCTGSCVEGSVQIECDRCKEAIWLSPSTPKNLRHLCMQCVMVDYEEQSVSA